MSTVDWCNCGFLMFFFLMNFQLTIFFSRGGCETQNGKKSILNEIIYN